MTRTKTLFMKELRSGVPAFLAVFAAVNWKLGAAMVLSTARGLDSMTFLVSGLEYDAMFLEIWMPAIVVFWFGLRAFAPEWRERTMIWLKTMPVSDNTVARVKLATGLAQLFFALVLGFAVRHTLWLTLGGAYGWKASNYFSFVTTSVVGILATTLWLAPVYLLGTLVSARVSRRWIAMGIGVAAWFGSWIMLGFSAAIWTDALSDRDLAHDLMHFQVVYPAVTVPLFLALVVVLVGLTMRTHRAREIAG